MVSTYAGSDHFRELISNQKSLIGIKILNPLYTIIANPKDVFDIH